MKWRIGRQPMSLGLLVLIAMFTTGCPSPDQKADQIFKDQGLNRIRKPNDYMQPGSVIIVKDKRAIYADNITDYAASTTPTSPLPIISGAAVIGSHTDETGMDANTALKFLDTLLPISASAQMKLTSNVNIEMINAKVKRIKIPDINAFLGAPDSMPFRTAVRKYIQDGNRVFIGYETYVTNKLKLKSVTGQDISTGVTTDKAISLFAFGEQKFSYKKTSQTEIIINGDAFYNFALRTGELKLDTGTGLISFKPTEFAPRGVLAAGTDDRFSSSLTSDNPLEFQSVDIIRQTREQ